MYLRSSPSTILNSPPRPVASLGPPPSPSAPVIHRPAHLYDAQRDNRSYSECTRASDAVHRHESMSQGRETAASARDGAGKITSDVELAGQVSISCLVARWATASMSDNGYWLGLHQGHRVLKNPVILPDVRAIHRLYNSSTSIELSVQRSRTTNLHLETNKGDFPTRLGEKLAKKVSRSDWRCVFGTLLTAEPSSIGSDMKKNGSYTPILKLFPGSGRTSYFCFIPLQVGDLITGGFLSFDEWLDAVDGSYCTFEGGDVLAFDPQFPNLPIGDFQEHSCGTVKPPYVISNSRADYEYHLSPFYTQRQCNEFGKLGLIGVMVLFSAGNVGAAGSTLGYFLGDNGACRLPFLSA
ncbi:hypothetical protein B0H19DRAFT_1276330 [Mycena capillaripes]|nr:hypothetical protein B0H19DRAFT_1276330 [Mycena capillaripes]